MHSNSPSYIRMALTLVDKVLKCRFKQPLPVPASASGSSKRPRNDFDSASFSGSWLYTARHPRQDHLPGFTLGGSPCGHSGSCGGKSGHFNSRTSHGGYSDCSTEGSGSGYNISCSSSRDSCAATAATIEAWQLSTFINSSHSLSFLFCKKMNEGTFYCYFTMGPTVLINKGLVARCHSF